MKVSYAVLGWCGAKQVIVRNLDAAAMASTVESFARQGWRTSVRRKVVRS